MSHYSKVNVTLNRQEAIIHALAQTLNIDPSIVEVHEEPVSLINAWNMGNGQGHIVVRAEHLSHICSKPCDIGVLRVGDEYQLVVEDIMLRYLGQDWTDRLMQQHALFVTREQLHSMGYTFTEDVDEAGNITLVAMS